MSSLSADIDDLLNRRLEQYRANQAPGMPSRAEVTRDALDEFLPELDEIVQAETQEAEA